ncbi:MAG TPA: hypothetical protein VIY90_06715 [Steroidobacteraceae bacterium]
MHSSWRVLWLMMLAPILVVAAAAGWADDAPPAAGQPAQWVSRKINFTYVGFVTRYTCDDLVDRMRNVLLVLGARKEDLNIHATGCTSDGGQVERLPGVAGTFSVLVSSEADSVDAVAAGWQRVAVSADASYCELLQQVGRKVLPLFSARNAQFSSTCPAQAVIGSQKLTAEVLAPLSAQPRQP